MIERDQRRRGARAGLRYGALAFLAGAVLGPVRELLLAPAIGGLPAALLEAGAMAVLVFLAARSVLDPASATTYLYVLCAEVIVAAAYLFHTYWVGMRNIMYANR